MAATATRREFRYHYHAPEGRGWWVAATREEWLQAILDGHNTPKPPDWWIAEQATENRTPKQAAIIWGRHYDAGRKYTIWSQAPDEDFSAGGYR